jgi:TDG/mug DNA glycosylase family protein
VRKGLPDYINPGCRILFVGLNPGLRSASVGHHFAGYSNKFWKLMVEAGFLPPGSSYRNDSDLPVHGWGLTNLVSRPTAGANDLGPGDFSAGRRALLLKIRRFGPKLVATLGVMVFRELLQIREPVRCGLQPQLIDGIAVFVLPNPSGRNAHFSYEEMLRHFRGLRKLVASKRFTGAERLAPS